MKRVCVVCIALFILAAGSSAQNLLDSKFLQGAAAVPPIERDAYISKYINSVVSGEARLLSFDKAARYGKNIRLILRDVEADSFGISIIYNVFVGDGNIVEILVTGDKLRFKGKLASVTPANTGRTI